MNANEMTEQVEELLARLDATELEERIAPVKCDKHPEAPECGGVPVPAYGIPADVEPA